MILIIALRRIREKTFISRTEEQRPLAQVVIDLLPLKVDQLSRVEEAQPILTATGFLLVSAVATVRPT
jgi:hypothetical protein